MKILNYLYKRIIKPIWNIFYVESDIYYRFRVPVIRGLKPVEILSLNYYTKWYDIFFKPKKVSIYLIRESSRIYIESAEFKNLLSEVEVGDVIAVGLKFTKGVGTYYLVGLPIEVEEMTMENSSVGLSIKIQPSYRFNLKTKYSF